MTKHVRLGLMLTIVLGTAAAFGFYFGHHPAAVHTLTHISPLILIALFALYVCFVVSLSLIQEATITLCRVQLNAKDSLILIIWSSIINFFAPLQSGPAFRAAYLKKVHHISLKTYGLATLLYYGLFAGFSGIFVLSAVVSWRILLALGVIGIAVVILLLRSSLPIAQQIRALPLREFYKLALATLLQVGLVAVIYGFELRAIDAHISIHQIIIYTGAANFALFVSLTPGAIGFREAFLLFSQNLHHINQSTILAASLIDRSIYVAFLGVLFLVAMAIHAKDRYTTTP